MLKVIKSLLPAGAKKRIRALQGSRAFSTRCFSQEGEDALLIRFFNDGKPGHFVDIGAHHPFRFSNTYALYLRGWRGINVDAMPGSMAPFRKHRPLDTNLEMGVTATPGQMRFHIFEEPAFNTFDPAVARLRESEGHPIKAHATVECQPLSAIVARHLHAPVGRNSLLSIDVEGLDLQVLRSNDWSLYRPTIVIAEVAKQSVEEMLGNEVSQYLREQGYSMYSKLSNSVFYRRDDIDVR